MNETKRVNERSFTIRKQQDKALHFYLQNHIFFKLTYKYVLKITNINNIQFSTNKIILQNT